MVKSLFGLLFVSLLSASWVNPTDIAQDIVVENNVLVSVNTKEAYSLRIYADKGVTTIGEHAFDDCSYTTMMISSTVRIVNSSFPAQLKTIEYTGASEDISFEIPQGIEVVEYADDEGFLNYWKEFIRPNINGSICNVSKEHYVKMKSLYNNLSTYPQDVETVENTSDGTGTIKDSIKYLDSYFGNSNRSQTLGKEISQSVMITLILIVASFGMTSIGLFYFLKDKKVIK